MNGSEFENQMDLASHLSKIPKYFVRGDGFVFFYEYNCPIMYHVAAICKKFKFYQFIEQNFGIDWHQRISRQLIPDDSIFILNTGTMRYERLYVIECKFQQVSGSADEKLTTCDFKRLEYQRLLCGTGINVEFFFILGNWFMNPKYEDDLDYVTSHGCRYFFDNIPPHEFGLPE